MANPFGRYLREQRERRRVSLRAFAVSIEMDPSNYSKIERGVLAPPEGEALERIGKALGIERFSPEWQRFHDLASVSRGRSEEHTSELQSREISYAVFCLKKKRKKN